MKNKITKIITLVSCCALVVIGGCQPKQSQEQTQAQDKTQTQNQTKDQDKSKQKKSRPKYYLNELFKINVKKRLLTIDTVDIRHNAFFETFLKSKSLKNKNATPSTADQLDLGNNPVYKFLYGFNCQQSNPTMWRHEIYYWDAFYYIWTWVDTFHKLHYAEIPVTNLDNIANPENGTTNRHSRNQCGELIYIGLNNEVISMSYHDEIIAAGTLPFNLFHKTTPPTMEPYNIAECPSTTDFNGTWMDLDAILSGPLRVCVFQPTQTINNADVNTQGDAFLSTYNLLYQNPFGFFHSYELYDLIHQTDIAPGVPNPDPLYVCTSVRIYVGLEDPRDIYQIRLVAFAVNKYGDNIIMLDDGSAAIMLEHSWPPF